MIVFLTCVAEAVVENGLQGLAGMVPFGPFAYDVARDALEKYRQRRRDAEVRAEVENLARLTFEQAREAAAEVAREVAADAPAGDRAALELYLSAVPAAVQRSLRRADDPTGITAPTDFRLDSPDGVLRLLPPRPPRFRPGDPLPGKPDWVLERPLGVGGFGEVWLARHPAVRSVTGAVKFCHDLQARDRDQLHEGRVLDRVMRHGRHPGVVPLVDARPDGDPPWLMFEYVDGGDLADLVHRLRSLPDARRVRQAVDALRQLAAAVGHFHRLDPPVVHRDLKPANVLVDRASGRLRVTDFGIGGVAARAALDAESRWTATRGGRLPTGLLGSYTPAYASPQQREGAGPDPRDDVHALGVIGYQLLTGHPTREAGPDFADDLREAGAGDGLIALLGRCVARRPDRRPADANALAAELDRLAAGGSPTPPVPPAADRPPPAPPATPLVLARRVPPTGEDPGTTPGGDLARDVEAFLGQVERLPGVRKREAYTRVLDDLVGWSRGWADLLEFRPNPPGEGRQSTVSFRLRGGGPVFWQAYPRPTRRDAKFCCYAGAAPGVEAELVGRFARLSRSGRPDSPRIPTLSFDDLLTEATRAELKQILGEVLAAVSAAR